MNRSYKQRLELFRRVRDFGAAHSNDFQPDSSCPALFTLVTDTITRMESGGSALTARRNNAGQAAVIRRTSVRELWGMLRDINRAARAMSAHMPAMDRKFRLPAQRNETTLLLTARAFAAEGEPLAGDFTRHELPAGFLERLHTLTAEVQADLEQRNGARAAGNQATVSLREAIRQGQLAVRQLNEMMRLKYAREGATLGEWDYVMRPGQASRGARAGKPADDETDNGVAPAPVVEPEVVETRRGRAAGK